jgi:lipopolysaccharide/colanic/teichoic acid biosynthesis glycosyltransferase
MSASNVEVASLHAPDVHLVARSRATDVTCRALDVVLAAVLLFVTAPLFLLIALLIRLDSPGPVFFRQRRLGLRETPFEINKFRTMRRDAGHDVHRAYVIGLIAGAEERNGGMFKLTGDARVTRVGRFLRRSSLDELPQLWNVITGEMSLVGPRPPIPYEVEHYPSHWFARFAVKPGLTGLWQVSGRCRLTLEQMIALDIEYTRRRSFWLNLWILVRTLPAAVRGGGAA